MSLYASPGGNAINVCGVCAHTVHVDVYVVCMLQIAEQSCYQFTVSDCQSSSCCP